MGKLNLLVKKIVSLDPDRFDYIEVGEAIRGYKSYIASVVKSPYANEAKGFTEWLGTEI